MHLLHKNLRVYLSLCVIGLVYPACTVSFPQVDAVRAQFGPSDQAALTVPKDAIWLASLREQGQLLAAYQREGFILFANADSDGRVEFDGWLVRSVSGFDLGDLDGVTIESVGNDGSRTISSRTTEFTTVCQSWMWFPGTGLSGTWEQVCDGFGLNIIRLNESGSIVLVDQVVTPSGDRLILQRYEFSTGQRSQS